MTDPGGANATATPEETITIKNGNSLDSDHGRRVYGATIRVFQGQPAIVVTARRR